MNKVFLGLILSVCILGMALVMLNDRLGRKAEPRQPAQATATVNDAEMAINARARELAEAAKSLAPPAAEEKPDTPLTSEAAPPIPEAPAKAEIIPPAAAAPEPVAQKPAPPRQDPPRAALPKPEPVATRPEPPKADVKPEPLPQKAEQAPRPADNKTGGKTVDRFVIYARDKGATVRVGGKSKLDYTSMTLENPDRIVVDITGDWKFPPNPGVPKNDLVSAVRVGQNGDKTRLVIDLKVKPRKVALVPFKGGDGVDVRVDK